MCYQVLSPKIKLKYFVLIIVFISLSLGIGISTADNQQAVTYNPADIEAAWTQWKANYVTAQGAGDAPRQRVLGGVSSVSTVSEGQAYGMLFASLFDEQSLLDSLWLFAADHLDVNGLMNWHILSYGVTAGTGAATDGDVDMAIAMVTACQKVNSGTWSPSPNDLNYCQIATDLINRIWEYEVDHPGAGPPAGLDDNPGYELLPGDQWQLETEYPEGIVNLSYFAPGYFRVFAEFTNNPGWYSVIDRNYEIADLSQQIEGNCSSLVPNWSQYDGQYQYVPWHGDTSEYWGYDGARFAWRIAIDSDWFDDPVANATLNEIGGFFSSIGINNIGAEYRLSGTYVSSQTNPFFLSTAASAIWGAPDPIASGCGQATGSLLSTPQQAYQATVNIGTQNYYNDSWRLLSMILMTGNFPNPMTLFDGTPPTATPTPTQPPLPPSDLPILDTFETTDGWVASGAWQHGAGSYENNGWAIDTANNRDTTSILERTQGIDLTDAEEPVIRYQHQGILSSTDTLYVDVSTDGGATWMNWNTSNNINIDEWVLNELNLSPMVGEVIQVRFRMMSTGSVPQGESSVGYRLDNFEVVEEVEETPEPSETPTYTATPDIVVSSDLSVTARIAQDAEQNTQFDYQITNVGSEPQTDVTARIYFDLDGGQSASSYILEKYYDSTSGVSVSSPVQWDDDTYYVELTYGDTPLNGGNSFVFHGALHLADWNTIYDSTNDWWRTNLTAGYTLTNQIPVYVLNTLQTGAEPDGNVLPPPTATNTPDDVVEASPTPTIPTSTPTQTNTPTSTPTIGDTTPSDIVVEGKVDGTDSAQQSVFNYRLTNTGSQTVSGVKVRIFFDLDNTQPASNYVLDVYYDQTSSATRSGPFEWDADTYYFEIDYGSYSIGKNQTYQLNGSIHLANWQSQQSSSSDWWRSGLTSSYTSTSYIPVYVNGDLVAGQEPGESSEQPATNTYTPTFTPTYTVTATNTPEVEPENTATFTSTFTPSPTFTLTFTPQPRATNTPLPTLTFTPIPTQDTGSGQVVTIQILQEGTDNNQQTQFRYQLHNDGNGPVSGLATRLYFDLDNGEPASNYVFESYYDSSSGAVVTGPYQWDSNTYYYEIVYNNAQLNAGSSFEYVGAMHLGNWASNFSSANDWWHRDISTEYTVTTYVPVYINGSLAFGQEPPAN